jgi:hypothetical protein
MRCVLLVLIVMVAQPLHGQVPRFGGTFIGAIIADEGIVMAADSRSTFVDEAGTPLGYVDRMPKVFAHQGAAFAVSGLISLDGELFSSFIRQNSFLLARPIEEILTSVSLWLPFKNSSNVLLISAGLSATGVPTICVRSPYDAQTCQKSGFITNRESENLRQWLEAQHRTPKVAEAAAALKRAIREASLTDPTIGGPLSVLLLPRSGSPVWLENPVDPSGWTRVCDIVTDYRRGRVTISHIRSREQLERHLSTVCPR